MYLSKLGTMVAILATAAGFSALAGRAEAQISGTIGGDIVDNDPLQVLGDPTITLTDGNVAFQSGHGKITARLTGTVHVVGGENARFRVRVDSFDRPGSLLGTAYDAPDGTSVHRTVEDILVDMEATTAPSVSRVVVAVEKRGTSGKWITRAANETYLDDDIGGPGFGSLSPLTPATVA